MARKADSIDPSQWPDEHPLFPVEDGEMPPAIAWIHVTRYEKGGQIWAERLFKAEELTDLSQVGQLYGGGQYELIGRQCSKKDPMKPGNILARRRYRIGGKSLPITDVADDEPDAVVPAFTAPGAGGLLGGGGDNQVLLAILQMSQQQQAAAASQQQQASQQFMQLMMQSMTSSKSESTALVTMMMQMSQQQQQSMVSMITAMMANRGGGPEEFAKYAELMKALGVGGSVAEKEDDSMNIGKMLEDAADVVQGLAQMKGLGVGPGDIDPANAPPGSAASVIAGGAKG